MIDKIAEILRDEKISVKGNILSGPEILILAQKICDALPTESVTVEWEGPCIVTGNYFASVGTGEFKIVLQIFVREQALLGDLGTGKNDGTYGWKAFLFQDKAITMIEKLLVEHDTPHSLESAQQAAIKFYNELQGSMLPITIGANDG